MGKIIMITVTENATTKINELILEESDPTIKLRMYVQGGGCSGFSYGFTFDSEQNDDDFTFEVGKTNMLVDSMSFQYLEGAVVDYKEDLQGSRFSITNPQATTTCGCGSSFSI
jgi:iron-sulfur cluster insertion protein